MKSNLWKLLLLIVPAVISSAVLAAAAFPPEKDTQEQGHHQITCDEAEDIDQPTFARLDFESHAYCSDWMDLLQANAQLQKRSGFWPFYSWNTVDSAYNECYYCDNG